MIDYDRWAQRVVAALRDAMYGSVLGLEQWDVSPVELPSYMGFVMGELGGRRANSARGWSLRKWVMAVREWISERDRSVVKSSIRPRPGATASKAYPNWLKPHELAAWKAARERAGLRMEGVADSVRARLRTIMADTIARMPGASQADIAATLARELKNAMPDIQKNWMRVARTETQIAFNEGVATIALARGRSQRVARVPQKDACERCKHLFLGSGGLPRIFSISELLQGNSDPENKPSTLPVHPNCRCSLVIVPDNFGFDENWNVTRLS